jgi:hypothetical protein
VSTEESWSCSGSLGVVVGERWCRGVRESSSSRPRDGLRVLKLRGATYWNDPRWDRRAVVISAGSDRSAILRQSLGRAGRWAPVAQRIEHLTTDQKVWGSNPYGRAKRSRRQFPAGEQRPVSRRLSSRVPESALWRTLRHTTLLERNRRFLMTGTNDRWLRAHGTGQVPKRCRCWKAVVSWPSAVRAGRSAAGTEESCSSH